MQRMPMRSSFETLKTTVTDQLAEHADLRSEAEKYLYDLEKFEQQLDTLEVSITQTDVEKKEELVQLQDEKSRLLTKINDEMLLFQQWIKNQLRSKTEITLEKYKAIVDATENYGGEITQLINKTTKDLDALKESVAAALSAANPVQTNKNEGASQETSEQDKNNDQNPGRWKRTRSGLWQKPKQRGKNFLKYTIIGALILGGVNYTIERLKSKRVVEFKPVDDNIDAEYNEEDDHTHDHDTEEVTTDAQTDDTYIEGEKEEVVGTDETINKNVSRKDIDERDLEAVGDAFRGLRSWRRRKEDAQRALDDLTGEEK